MQAMRFKEFKKVVGQNFITAKTNKFPLQGWGSKTIDNVIYVWAKSSAPLMEIAKIEATSGKQVKISIVPKAIIHRAGL